MADILISVGSNVDRDRHIKEGIKALRLLLTNVKLSSVYESEAVGFDGEPFYNMAVAATTDMNVSAVVKCLKKIEDDNGRIRKCEKFSSRTLDLDLLTYDQLVIEQPVELPRDEITKNAFVLWPLAEIAADVQHPVIKKSYAQLWHEFNKSKQKLWVVNFNWA